MQRMNLSEFKAWFEGFTESLSGAPNAKQWARIKEKISKIEDAPPVTYKIFHDYWERPWRRWMEPTWTTTYSKSMQSTSGAMYSADGGNHFDSKKAFKALGNAEWRSMT